MPGAFPDPVEINLRSIHVRRGLGINRLPAIESEGIGRHQRARLKFGFQFGPQFFHRRAGQVTYHQRRIGQIGVVEIFKGKF